MDDAPEELKRLAERVIGNPDQSETESVRTLLGWFGANRRGAETVRHVRRALSSLGLRTVPDFETAYIESSVEFQPCMQNKRPPASGARQTVSTGTGASRREQSKPGRPSQGKKPEEEPHTQAPVSETQEFDVVSRIRQLDAANQFAAIERNKQALPIPHPTDPIARAETFLLMGAYDQLPVMETPYKLVGYISWKTIGEARAHGCEVRTVKDGQGGGNVPCVSDDTPILEAVSEISRYGFVFVRDAKNRLIGVVSSRDIATHFQRLAEPMVLIGQIEGHLRRILRATIPLEGVKRYCDPGDTRRKVESVDDLTFGEYLRILQKDHCWTLTGINLDKQYCLTLLDQVRGWRNDIAHFRPDPLDEDDMRRLRIVAEQLSRIRPQAPQLA